MRPLHPFGLVPLLLACRVDPLGGRPFAGSEESGEPPASGGGSSSRGGSAGGGALGGDGPRSDGGLSGVGPGGAGDGPAPGACDAQSVTLDEIRSGEVLPSVTVTVVATATSQKYLVSQSQSGSCLWGAFVGDTPAFGEPRGLLVVSYGPEAPGDERCAPGGDALPDTLAPGDRVLVVGRASNFAPTACEGTIAAPQILADARCPVERLEHARPLEPVALPLDVANALGNGNDAELVRRWAGGLVRLEAVNALPNESGNGAVRPYGVVALAETELEVHADIEYGDLSGAGPRDSSKGLDFPYPTAFRSVTGLVLLDYCDYALAPRSRCRDFDPPSLGCP
jgi:hypothetical protein